MRIVAEAFHKLHVTPHLLMAVILTLINLLAMRLLKWSVVFCPCHKMYLILHTIIYCT